MRSVYLLIWLLLTSCISAVAEAQVGPDPHYSVIAHGDFAVVGASTRQYYGAPQTDPFTLTLTSLPSGATILKAFVNWSYLTRDDPTLLELRRITINGANVWANESDVRYAGPDLCWGQKLTATYTADVTGIVDNIRNGDYVIGSATDMYDPEDYLLLGEGISLVVVYSVEEMPLRLINVYLGIVEITGPGPWVAPVTLSFKDNVGQEVRYIGGPAHFFMNTIDGQCRVQLDGGCNCRGMDDFWINGHEVVQFPGLGHYPNVFPGQLGPGSVGFNYYDHAEGDVSSFMHVRDAQLYTEADTVSNCVGERCGDCTAHSIAAVAFVHRLWCDEEQTPGNQYDCNGNTVPDICDIRQATSWDLDGNWVPDECDPDCNDNGWPDGYEIKSNEPSFEPSTQYAGGRQRNVTARAKDWLGNEVPLDVDADGDVDLLTADDAVHKVGILLNNAGVLTYSSSFSVPTGTSTCPFDVTAGYFDADNYIDFAAVLQATPGQVVVALNRGFNPGWLGFSPTTTTLESAVKDPESIVTGDFDGDGDLDLAIVGREPSPNYPYVSVRYGSNDGSFPGVNASPFQIANISSLTARGRDIASADFNNDGRDDLAVAVAITDNDPPIPPDVTHAVITLLLSSGGTNAELSFDIENIDFCMYPEALVSLDTADLENDGDQDILLLTNGATRNAMVVLSNLGGQGEQWLGFDEPRVFPEFGTSGGRWSIAAADIDGDGFPDALVTDRSDGYLYVLVNDRTGEFGAPFGWALGDYQPEGLTVGRFNGDNLLDVAVARVGTTSVKVLMNGTLAPTSLDLDSNGVPDECVCVPAQIALADPPDGVVDARQPHAPTSALPRQGIGSPGEPGSAREPITITLEPPLAGLEECFELCETVHDATLGPNWIQSVTYLGGGVYEIALDHAITAGGVTSIGYRDYYGEIAFVEYTAHPANVNGDSVSNGADILAIINCLNLVQPEVYCPWGVHSCDADHSNVCAPADILRVIDLLNGVDAFDPWLGFSRPGNTFCPPGAWFAGAGGAGAGAMEVLSDATLSDADGDQEFIQGFIIYLTSTTVTDSAGDAEFKAIVEALTGFCVQNLSPEERVKLVEKLEDPSLTFASEAAAAMVPEIVASLTE